jgi:hypothetical protein
LEHVHWLFAHAEALTPLYLPAAHAVHWLFPAAAAVLAAHDLQPVAAPVVSWYCPAAQGPQDDWPVAL